MAPTKKSLKVFMREEAKTEEVITVPGPPSFKDENGDPIQLEIRILHRDKVDKIVDAYRTRTIATDKRGQPYIQNGEVAYKVEHETKKASNHILVEALVYPDLKDKELMEFYNCYDVTEMPSKVFPKADEFTFVNRAVTKALGLASEPDGETKEAIIDDLKN